MVDINNDGYLDIYVSVSGPEWSKPAERANLLFINNRNRTFTEAAAQYGIADTGFTTHAVFLDYNGDGCLDLFLLNNSPQDFSRGDRSQATRPGMRGETPGSYNELYRNNCHGTFTNVSARSGHPARARLRTRRRGRRPQRRWLARHLRLQRRHAQRRAVRQQRQRHVHQHRS